MLPLVSLLGNSSGNYAAQLTQKTSDAPTGTLQKMIVESGSVTMDLDLNGFNGSSSLVARPVTLQFAVEPIPSFLFWCLTICYADPRRDRWL